MNREGIAQRMKSIRPFYVMELLARARALEAEGRSIIHMEVGEPDFATPQPIVDGGKRALDEGRTGYTPATGIPELRRAIADDYKKRYGAEVNPERIVVTPGSSGALQLVMSVLVNPGEAVLMADPGYPCNRHFVQLVAGEPVTVPVGAESGYQLTAEMVEKAWSDHTRAVMVATPSNPTGTLLSREELESIYRVVSQRGGVLIVDEIYQGLVYGGESCTALAVADDIFVINSFSKYYGMTGWRLGWLVAPESHLGAIERLAQNIFLSAPTPAQYAALSAFGRDTQEIVEQRKTAFQARRIICCRPCVILDSKSLSLPAAPSISMPTAQLLPMIAMHLPWDYWSRKAWRLLRVWILVTINRNSTFASPTPPIFLT